MIDQQRTRWIAAIAVALVLVLPTWSGEAHEIPADVTVQAFVKPDGETLRMLVRVPLASLRDYNFATREPGYLEISESENMVLEAADVWVGDYVSMLENGIPARASCSRGCPRCDSGRPCVPELGSCLRQRLVSPSCRRHRAAASAGDGRRAPGMADHVGVVGLFDRVGPQPPRAPHCHGAAFPPGRGCRASVPVLWRSRCRSPRPPLAPGCLALRRLRLRAHPRRDRSHPLPAGAWSSRCAA